MCYTVQSRIVKRKLKAGLGNRQNQTCGNTCAAMKGKMIKMTETLKGTIQAVSEKTTGLMIKDKWYTVIGTAKAYVKNKLKGEVIEYGINKYGKIMYFKVIGTMPSVRYSPDKIVPVPLPKIDPTQQQIPGVANGLFKQKCDLLLACKEFVLKNFDINEFPAEIRGTFINTLFIEINKNLRN